jgi:RimJ/RimL family protein N-acetyltransferase
MQVRSATFEDCDAIGQGMKVVVDEGIWLATEAASAEELAERHRTAILAGDPLFVLEDGGEIVGCLGMPAENEGIVSLGMWVLPSHRRRGGGRLLLQAAIDDLPPDIHRIELEVWPDNEAAIQLYRKAGFEEEGVRRNHYRRRDGTLRSSLIMARLLET